MGDEKKTPQQQEPAAAPKRVNIKLLKNHTDAGKDYKAGETLENIDEPTAAWLIKHEIGVKA